MNEIKPDSSILIVEDDPIIARVLETILKDSGYPVNEIVNSGKKAIESVAAQKPGIVLMDIDLLGALSGIDTARIILDIFSVPVIFITGHDEAEILNKAMCAYPVGFLVKPVSQNILNNTIRVGLNLFEKICSTTEGKTGGLTPEQKNDLISSLKPVILLDDMSRIIWMNDAAEYLTEQLVDNLLLSDGSESIVLHDPISEELVDIFSLDPVQERPLLIHGVHHKKEVIPRIFIISDPFGDIGGYYLELVPSG